MIELPKFMPKSGMIVRKALKGESPPGAQVLEHIPKADPAPGHFLVAGLYSGKFQSSRLKQNILKELMNKSICFLPQTLLKH